MEQRLPSRAEHVTTCHSNIDVAPTKPLYSSLDQRLAFEPRTGVLAAAGLETAYRIDDHGILRRTRKSQAQPVVVSALATDFAPGDHRTAW